MEDYLGFDCTVWGLRITECWELGRDHKIHLGPTLSAVGRDTSHESALLKALSSLALHTAGLGASRATCSGVSPPSQELFLPDI